jgi:hypothetical protein
MVNGTDKGGNMQGEPTIRIADLQEGCYIDSHHGIYAGPMAVRLAQAYGMNVSDDDELVLAAAEEGDYPIEGTDPDAINWILEETEDWLNANLRDDDHFWGWNDGDFGYYANEDDES